MASQNPCGFTHCSYSTFAFVHSTIFSVRCLNLLGSYASNLHMHHIPASCTRLHLPFKNVNRGRVSLLPIISRSLTIFEDATTKNKLLNRERTHDLDQASGFSLCLLVTNANGALKITQHCQNYKQGGWSVLVLGDTWVPNSNAGEHWKRPAADYVADMPSWHSCRERYLEKGYA